MRKLEVHKLTADLGFKPKPACRAKLFLLLLINKYSYGCHKPLLETNGQGTNPGPWGRAHHHQKNWMPIQRPHNWTHVLPLFWKRSPASFSQHWVSQKRRPYLFHLCFFQSLHLAHFAGTHEMVRWCFKKMLKWCSIFSARPGNFPQHLTVSTWPETPGKLFPEISPVFHPHPSSSNGALSPPHCPGWRTMELQEQVQKPPCVKASL